jgi:8-oxo-dGTP pyrophosphatase MutT (NUDIX family)
LTLSSGLWRALDEATIRAQLSRNGTGKAESKNLHQPERKFRRASVLMPLFREHGEWQVLFIRRTETVLDHKGQVAFPGGSAESFDRDAVDTALRETQEEIGLPQDKVQVLGRLVEFTTITDFLITPVIGCVPWPFDVVLSIDEVARVFSIPLAWLADPDNREEKNRALVDGRPEKVIYFKPYDGELLWGVTARIMVNFIQLLEPNLA